MESRYSLHYTPSFTIPKKPYPESLTVPSSHSIYKLMSTEFPVVPLDRVDEFGELIGRPDIDVELAIGQIPSLFGSSDMATFLAYRSLGFSIRQAFQIMNKPESLLDQWRDDYPEFVTWEFTHLPTLQKQLSKLVVRQSMMRNLMVCFNQDWKILAKTMEEDGLEQLTKREFQYLMAIRPKYTTNDLLAIEKMINPEDYRGDTVVNMTWDTREQKVEIHNSIIPELSSGSPSSD